MSCALNDTKVHVWKFVTVFVGFRHCFRGFSHYFQGCSHNFRKVHHYFGTARHHIAPPKKFGHVGYSGQSREAPVRFGYGLGVERFERFLLCKKGFFSVFQYSLTVKDGSCFGSWETVLAVPVPLLVSGKTVPTVPVPTVPVRFLSHPAKGFPMMLSNV